MPRSSALFLDIDCGTHYDGGSWTSPMPKPPTESINDPSFLNNLDKAMSNPEDVKICTLPVLDCQISEIPKRSPLDWRDNPSHLLGINMAITDAVYLDSIFERLYLGSPTFRAMLVSCPAGANLKSILWEPDNFHASYSFEYREVEVNFDLYTHANELKAIPLAVISHEYRHHYQETIKAAFSTDAPLELHHFFALCLAAEADAMCFGLICAYEVLLHEGNSPQKAQEIINNEAILLGDSLTKSFLKALQNSTSCHLTGEFSQIVIGDFITQSNELRDKYIRTYSEIYKAHMGHPLQAAETFYNSPYATTRPKNAHINGNGQLIIGDGQLSTDSKTTLSTSFRRLARMTYINKSGELMDRPYYMTGLTPQHFIKALSF